MRNRTNKYVMCDASSSALSQVFLNGIAAKSVAIGKEFVAKMKLKVFSYFLRSLEMA